MYFLLSVTAPAVSIALSTHIKSLEPAASSASPRRRPSEQAIPAFPFLPFLETTYIGDCLAIPRIARPVSYGRSYRAGVLHRKRPSAAEAGARYMCVDMV